jgi:hypothetical protein
MKDARPPPRGLEQIIQSSDYFRAQAAVCLEIARHIDDPQAVKNLRASACRHLVKASDVEPAARGTDPLV